MTIQLIHQRTCDSPPRVILNEVKDLSARERRSFAALRMTVLGTVALGMVALASGCKPTAQNGSGGSLSSPSAAAASQPVQHSAGSIPVRSGVAPISYLLGSGGKLSIVDATTGKEVVNQTIPPNTAISINNAAGIRIADETVVKGPLPPGHRYELWLER